MSLTERAICELYARVQNLKQSPNALCELLHPQAEWVTKWWIGRGIVEIEVELHRIRSHHSNGLSHVELVTGHNTDDGQHVDCTVSVRPNEPEKHDLRTYCKTDGQRITRIFTYAEWLDRTWPYPERVKHKLAELIVQGVPIAAISEKQAPRKLIWPDDGRTLENEKVRENDAALTEARLAMAKILDADQKGAPIPDLGLE